MLRREIGDVIISGGIFRSHHQDVVEDLLGAGELFIIIEIRRVVDHRAVAGALIVAHDPVDAVDLLRFGFDAVIVQSRKLGDVIQTHGEEVFFYGNRLRGGLCLRLGHGGRFGTGFGRLGASRFGGLRGVCLSGSRGSRRGRLGRFVRCISCAAAGQQHGQGQDHGQDTGRSFHFDAPFVRFKIVKEKPALIITSERVTCKKSSGKPRQKQTRQAFDGVPFFGHLWNYDGAIKNKEVHHHEGLCYGKRLHGLC